MSGVWSGCEHSCYIFVIKHFFSTKKNRPKNKALMLTIPCVDKTITLPRAERSPATANARSPASSCA